MGNVQPPQGAEEAYAVAAAGQKILRNLDVAPQLHAPEATKNSPGSSAWGTAVHRRCLGVRCFFALVDWGGPEFPSAF